MKIYRNWFFRAQALLPQPICGEEICLQCGSQNSQKEEGKKKMSKIQQQSWVFTRIVKSQSQSGEIEFNQDLLAATLDQELAEKVFDFIEELSRQYPDLIGKVPGCEKNLGFVRKAQTLITEISEETEEDKNVSDILNLVDLDNKE